MKSNSLMLAFLVFATCSGVVGAQSSDADIMKKLYTKLDYSKCRL